MANIKFTAKEEAFVAAMYKASGAVGVLAAKINTDLVRSYREADAVQRILNKGIVRFGEDAMATGQKLSIGLTAPILALGAAGIKSFADVEALLMGLEVVEGSSNAAASSFERIKAIAKAPGLGFMEAAQGYTNLRAVGFGADFAEKSLKNLGNALALSGKGKFEFGSILTQLTQMSSKSAVLAEDLKPILNSAPVIAKLLKEMYGTVDSEGISNQLKAQGKGPADFINELMTALDGVKKVSGGAKNAIENMGDSLKIAGSNIGEVVNKSTGLTSAITNAGDAVVDITEWFKELSPEMQNFILLGVGGAAAIGPLAYGVGSLTSALPGLITNLNMANLVTGGWVIAIAAAGAAILMARNQHQEYLEAIEPTTKTINDSAIGITKETNALWSNVDVLKNAKAGTDQFLNAKNQLIAINPSFEEAIKGEIVDIDKLGQVAIKTSENLVRMAAAKRLMSKRDQIAEKIDFYESGQTNLGDWSTGVLMNTMRPGTDPSKKFIDNKIKTLKDVLKETTDVLNKEYADMMLAISGANIVTPKTSPAFGKTGEGVKKAVDKTKKEVKKAAEEYVDEVALAVESMEQANKDLASMFNRVAENDFSTMLNGMGTGVPTTELNWGLSPSEEEMQKATDRYADALAELQNFKDAIPRILSDGTADAIGTFFENIGYGEGISGGFKGMMGSLTSTLGQLLMDFGKKALAVEMAIKAVKFGLGGGIGPAIAAIALGGIIKGAGASLKAPKFAQGGIVKGPGLATVGDNPGRFEAIIPIEKMPSIFGKMVQQNNNGYIATVDVALDRLRIGLARLEKNM